MLRVDPLTLDSESRALYDRFVPANHPLRQFDQYFDFSFILTLVAERYHDAIGRPAEGSFGYDDLGNLTNLNGLGLTYTGSPVHAPPSVNGVGYTYDTSGNLTNDGARTYGYDGENRLTSVSNPALGYVYDYDGKRLQRTKGAVTTLYVGERYAIDLATGETTAYYPWGGQPLPMRQGNDLYLLHADRLGSITNASDASGASIATQRYTAYGSRWATKSSGTMPTDRGFTGQIRDGSRSSFDFYFYRSRYYNSSIGKFVQADTVVPDPKNPQTLNRYAYGLNNPLKYIDPSGHLSQDQIDGYLKQQYGDKWRTYLKQWEANEDWWTAITRAKPGDYLRSNGQYARLTTLGTDGYSLTFDNGTRQVPLSSWSGRDVDLVLHQQASNVWQSFAYNELDQLVSTSGAVSESYGTYLQGSADLGNLLSSREGTYSYPSAGQPRPHAPTAVGSASYQYDLNGDRQSDPTFGYTFDVENHLTKVTQGGTVVLRNTFDGDGNRLVRVVNGTKTHYVGDWYEFDPDTGLATVYYPFNGQPIAMKQGETLYYLHRDQVGSVVAVSDDSGNEVGTARYWPFGGLRLSTGLLPTDRLFTGQIRDLNDDRFYFFKARYYDATIGKFIQPDPLAPVVGKPPSLNRYAYADNNPLRYRDSTGHYTESSKEMTSPGIVVNNPPPAENKPLIYVTPPRPSGPLIFTGGLNLPTINVTTTNGPDLSKTLIFVQGEQDRLIYYSDQGRKLLRGMRGDEAGKPELGQSATTLGIRPGKDITPDENGNVHPGQGGLSVTPDDISKLPDHALPKQLGGKGKFPVWSINEGDLGSDLQYRPDPDKPDRHGYIEPADDMHIDQYRQAINDTQGQWVEENP